MEKRERTEGRGGAALFFKVNIGRDRAGGRGGALRHFDVGGRGVVGNAAARCFAARWRSNV